MEKIFRNCPNCSTKIFYTQVASKNNANKKNSLCKVCSKKGEKNSFFGKKHKKESVEKRLNTLKSSDKWKKSVEQKKSEEYRKKLSEQFSGEKNPAFKRGTLENIWIKKYGAEEAEKRQKKWKDKLRLNSIGENNNMFGKPSPIGSGNGWSGWYKGWYFRSLRELSYMINEIEKNNLNWENGELKKYKINYIDWKGDNRNYFSDFIIEGKLMIECKPLNLQNSKDVVSKKEAAERFCEDNNMEYVIVEPKMIENEKIKELYHSGIIVFLPRYEKKFLEKYN